MYWDPISWPVVQLNDLVGNDEVTNNTKTVLWA